MTEIAFPYGKGTMKYDFADENLAGVLESEVGNYVPRFGEEETVKNAMENPISSSRLCELAVGKKNIVIISSDHTRPVPSKIIMPLILSEIRSKNKDAVITILIATGCHRGTTKEELTDKFGKSIVENENIYIHDCDDENELVSIGELPSGGECRINKLAAEADLLVAEGFIEPHFFAGFSGGRKSVLPGIAARKTVMANHCAEFIASEFAKTGILKDNPIHTDMLWAAEAAGLKFIVNVVINSEKKIIYAVSGEPQAAHSAGCEFLSSKSAVKAKAADIAISTNGGYPLDQNVYQSVKGMTAAEATVRRGGVIVMLSNSGDGFGGDYFYHQIADEPDIKKTLAAYMARGRSETLPDQWEVQILIRILLHASVIYVSSLPDEAVKQMHMIPAHSIDEALKIAKSILKNDKPEIVAIPDGVSVIVKK